MKLYDLVTVGQLASVGDGENWQVHKHGCRDVTRIARMTFCDVWDRISAESAEALVDAEVAVYTAQDQGWSHDDHRIMPCCKDAPDA